MKVEEVKIETIASKFNKMISMLCTKIKDNTFFIAGSPQVDSISFLAKSFLKPSITTQTPRIIISVAKTS